MSRLPRLTGSEIIDALGKTGVVVVRIKGSPPASRPIRVRSIFLQITALREAEPAAV